MCYFNSYLYSHIHIYALNDFWTTLRCLNLDREDLAFAVKHSPDTTPSRSIPFLAAVNSIFLAVNSRSIPFLAAVNPFLAVSTPWQRRTWNGDQNTSTRARMAHPWTALGVDPNTHGGIAYFFGSSDDAGSSSALTEADPAAKASGRKEHFLRPSGRYVNSWN